MTRLNAYSVYDKPGYLFGLYKAASKKALQAHLALELGARAARALRVEITTARSAAQDEWRIVA